MLVIRQEAFAIRQLYTIQKTIMPNSTDNQDYKNEDKKPASGPETMTGPAQGNLPLGKKDENNFTSDDQKGKKVDADPEKEEGKPADQ